MTRRHLTFKCAGETVVGTLDEAPGKVGLLIVSGGNITRNGAFAGMSRLAARMAERGYPVFRFDRRGVGDSSGYNAGYEGSSLDIERALAQFRREWPGLRSVVAFGNCDAASALMLGNGFGCDGLVLANPWTFDNDGSEEHTPGAIKSRYMRKLRDPRELQRLVTGKVRLRKVARSVRRALRGDTTTTHLGEDMADGLASYRGDVLILLAGRDRTAQAFRTNYPLAEENVMICPGADHAFSEPEHADWMTDKIAAMLAAQD
ncbi:hydrolase 1, exosortase A system-associated [Aurantiacibacter poecillastricola]|uniref:hydrolase 1, exosortase A system-associated n=1 Tax=Aurantiacibacter poecillastricola TaxID=3064385 RepID=UPI00273D2880|nr:hydrolase 1, exosortase A system-associated [Aurantiacibacter sp. 219JJ12-13]MDP5262171.1 hydrolase 1, exosortase A system-associated [Aurantiacibacter sp. 219JJ12-13]